MNKSSRKNHARELAAKLQTECLGARVDRLHRLIARRYALALRPLGVTLPQIEVLATLILHEAPIKPTALADLLAVERSTISRNLALMTTAGWVAAAETSPGNRAMAVTITAAGIAKLTAARAAWSSAQASLVETLGPDTAKTLDRWLARLA